jgi:CMP-N-acetylneuraminic acid synthetase
MTARVVALVPMRHASERVPGKNYRCLGEKPLYRHILDTLLTCPLISEVVVDTDSPVIAEGLSKDLPEVRLIERPQHLRAADIPMNDVLLHDLSLVEADFYLQTHSTNPFLKAETIERAIRVFLESLPRYDSLFSVTAIQTRLWDGLVRPINHNPAILLRTQDLAPVYEENSNLYLFSAKTLRVRHNRIGERPLLFEIDRAEAWDIDNELEFRIAEFLCAEMGSML